MKLNLKREQVEMVVVPTQIELADMNGYTGQSIFAGELSADWLTLGAQVADMQSRLKEVDMKIYKTIQGYQRDYPRGVDDGLKTARTILRSAFPEVLK